MRKGKLVSKIFGIALVFVVIGTVLGGIGSVRLGDWLIDSGKGVEKGDVILIGDIKELSGVYEGKTVTIEGTYRGWQAGFGSPPVTRSDWIVEDETGWIYVTGEIPNLDPVKDVGTKVKVTGVVRKNEQVYIEATTVQVGGKQ